EQPKVDDIIEYRKANPETKVVVTGYADKETGTAPYNMSLSKRRAEAVAAAIMKAGISADRISTAAKGDTVQPFEGRVKNRVAIAVAE
ncbi:OmpA family protein, partial [uncultured Duncaniella sp.]|uniref:OmpA family protein n=1 Tax=uncultured Duncaniella sp. TaxID=2768039 RepID=UPI0026E23A1D